MPPAAAPITASCGRLTRPEKRHPEMSAASVTVAMTATHQRISVGSSRVISHRPAGTVSTAASANSATSPRSACPQARGSNAEELARPVSMISPTTICGARKIPATGTKISAVPKPEKPRTIPAAPIASKSHGSPGVESAAATGSGIGIRELRPGVRVRLGPVALDPEPHQDRGGHEDRRVGADHDAPDHREDEAPDHVAAEEIEREERQQRGDRGHDR